MTNTSHTPAQGSMPSAQVIYDDALILPLFSTPWAEQEASLMLESLGECMPQRPIILWDLRGDTTLK